VKKVVLGIILLISFVVTSYATESNRKVFSIKNPQEKALVIKVGEQSFTVNASYASSFPDSVLLPFGLKKSQTKNDFFTTLTMGMRYFLENYKIGEIDKKTIMVWMGADSKDFPFLYKINVNSLKMINNRDFGSKDLMAFEEGMVYPLKVILEKGIFIDLHSEKKDEKMTKEYKSFLKSFEFPGLSEAMIENFYAHKKFK
jgi:hypothetical protein